MVLAVEVDEGLARVANDDDRGLVPEGVGSTEAPRVCRSLSFLSVSRFRCAVRPMTVVEKTVSFPGP